jgi:methyl-accepting chemotaxis protein
MGQLSKATQQNASASEELAATSEELSGQAEQLQQSVAFFSLGDSGLPVPRQEAAPRRRAPPAPGLRMAAVAGAPVPRYGAGAGAANFRPY